MDLKHRGLDLLTKGMNVVHRAALAATGGRLGRQVFGMPAVQLHTTGRKSGRRRSVMLTTPIREGDRLVVIASKGGDDHHPEWYLNLVAEPDVEVTEDGVTRQMRARTASPEERAELWPQVVAAYKGYAGYQRSTEREIPVVLLEPRA
jgi:deazaflavin-dependent oxidoreductase (nitroreductase family)